MLRHRLENHVLGRVDMTPTQLKAAEILLRKSLPDLSSVQLSGDAENPVAIQEIAIRAVDDRPSEESEGNATS